MVGDWGGWFFTEKMVEEIKEESRREGHSRESAGVKGSKAETTEV